MSSEKVREGSYSVKGFVGDGVGELGNAPRKEADFAKSINCLNA